jgi:hypothetical protein
MNINFKTLTVLSIIFGFTGLTNTHAASPTDDVPGNLTYCYRLGNLAKLTVLNKIDGKTLEEQMAKREVTLGKDSSQYKLIEDVAKQIYEKNLDNPMQALVETNGSCLKAKELFHYFSDQAANSCPKEGSMIAEVSTFKGKGASIDQIKESLGNRYGDMPLTYRGGLDKWLSKPDATNPKDDGSVDYMLCMVGGMKK